MTQAKRAIGRSAVRSVCGASVLLAFGCTSAVSDDEDNGLGAAGVQAGQAASGIGGAGAAGIADSVAGFSAGGQSVAGAAGVAVAGSAGVAGVSAGVAAGVGGMSAGTAGMVSGMGAGMGGLSGAPAGMGAGTGGMGGDDLPTLPMISDPGGAGPFSVETVSRVTGLSTHTLFVPSETASHGKHPAVVWTCGNGGTVTFYQSFLEHLAEHGFLVVADNGSSADRLAEVESQKDAIDWLHAEDARSGGELFGKIDLDRIAVMGHSLGSLASFATAAQDARVATSVHYSGGLTGNPVGFDESWLSDMTKPAAFLCGGSDTTAGPSCEMDFEQAPPSLKVFYGVLGGASHIGPFALTPRAGEYGRAGVAWLRWRLLGDAMFESYFVGASCSLCSSPWTAQQRNLP